MTRRVTVSQAVYQQAHDESGEDRGADGEPSEYDFVAGPLQAALFAFRGFDEMGYDLVPEVRRYIILDPVFGPVAFTGVLMPSGEVEIAAYSRDPDYWRIINADP